LGRGIKLQFIAIQRVDVTVRQSNYRQC